MLRPTSRATKPIAAASGDTQSHLPPSLQIDTEEFSSTPECSFRQAIITAAERLAQPVTKKRKVVSGQSHALLRKIKEQKALNDFSETPPHVNSTREEKLETNGLCKADDAQNQAANQGLSTALSKRTLDRLDVFWFQLPHNGAILTSNPEKDAMHKSPLINHQTPNNTVLLNMDSCGNVESQRSHQLMDSARPLENILPLEHELLSQSGVTRDKNLLIGTHPNSSSLSFETDDFDQSSLEDAFQAAEGNMNQHVDENVDHEALISNPDTRHRFNPSDSDFGSDPFEPDDAGSQNELCQLSSHVSSSLDSQTCQAAEVDFSKSQQGVETSLLPSYQIPREFPPTTDTPNNPQPHHSATPAPPPTHNKPPPQQQLSPTPFLRSTFPTPILSHSPISNTTPTTRILTCFRIAEYLRAISSTTNTHPSTPFNLLIELYATVTSSTRNNSTQHFTFSDLFFPHRPPHLQGVWHNTWQSSDLYEDDTRPFLSASKETGKGKMCRAIVRPRGGKLATAAMSSSPAAGVSEAGSAGSGRGGDGDALTRQIPAEVEVLSIWEADWEDVEYVRGIMTKISHREL